jgi:hypothetical protein
VWLFADRTGARAWSAHSELDKYITRYAAAGRWSAWRTPTATCCASRSTEILYRDGHSPSVSINEAVELPSATNAESAKFINGILAPSHAKKTTAARVIRTTRNSKRARPILAAPFYFEYLEAYLTSFAVESSVTE